jgi:hypothetical protein
MNFLSVLCLFVTCPVYYTLLLLCVVLWTAWFLTQHVGKQEFNNNNINNNNE